MRLMPAVLFLAVGISSCRKTPHRVFIPPPPAPIAIVNRDLPVIPAPQFDARFPPAEVPAYPTPAPPVLPPPPPPRPATATQPPRPAPSAPVATIPEPVPIVPAPKLGQVFTEAQSRDYNRNLNESLERVRQALAFLAAKSLSQDQMETVSRITNFQKQAEQAREQDLVTAVNLARRADVLAQDLLKRLP